MPTVKVKMTTDKAALEAMIVKSCNAGLTMAGIVAVRHIRKSFAKNGKGNPSAPGTPPNRHNGVLYNSIASTEAKELRAAVYTSNVKYAPVHEYGGVIRGQTGRLTIPLNREAILLRERTVTLRSVPGLVYVPRRGRDPLLVLPIKGGKGMKPYFVLKRSVRIPARPFMAPAFRNADNLANMAKAFARASRAALQGAVIKESA